MSIPINSISNPRFKLEVLSKPDIERIHTATLDIIETAGVKFPLPRALNILEEHGASVDRATSIAKIPAKAIMNALKSAPPAYTLAARDPVQDLLMDGRHVFLGTDGCGVQVMDLESGALHRSAKADVARSALVADALDEVGFWWAMVSAQDCPPESRGLHELEAAWTNTTKHLQTESLLQPGEMKAAVEMASAIAGGRDALRKRPLLSIMQCTIARWRMTPAVWKPG